MMAPSSAQKPSQKHHALTRFPINTSDFYRWASDSGAHFSVPKTKFEGGGDGNGHGVNNGDRAFLVKQQANPALQGPRPKGEGAVPRS
jgi:hypothetical protein